MIVPTAQPCQSGIEAPVQLNIISPREPRPFVLVILPSDLPAVHGYCRSFVAGAESRLTVLEPRTSRNRVCQVIKSTKQGPRAQGYRRTRRPRGATKGGLRR